MTKATDLLTSTLNYKRGRRQYNPNLVVLDIDDDDVVEVQGLSHSCVMLTHRNPLK